VFQIPDPGGVPRAEPGRFGEIFTELSALLAPVFSRRDLRANATAYQRGLLTPGTLGNCWALAEAAGHERPHRLQHLLSGAVWDEDAARDAVRAFLARHLGADGGVLIFDETGQAKKGTTTAAAGRQYSGTMGRVENVIVTVCTTYAAEEGHALFDRDLYVQEDWFAEPERMAKAGFPADHAFATKPELALAQAKRALSAGIHPMWAAATRCTGAVANCAGSSRTPGSATCSRCQSITTSPLPARCACAPTRHWLWSSPPGGTGACAGPGRRGRTTTTGRGSPLTIHAANF
jgi:SRSO17 transposase